MSHYSGKIFGILQKKLAEIQSSNETTKKRWLIALSAAAMTIVVALWVVYMNFTITSFDYKEMEGVKGETFEGREFSELASSALYNLRNVLAGLFSKFGSTNQIQIKREEFNFIPD